MEYLAELLKHIVLKDREYEARYILVLQSVAHAQLHGLNSGFRFDPAEPEWPVAFIELPTGQISWHLPQHPTEWDGHTTEEKFERIRRFVQKEVE